MGSRGICLIWIASLALFTPDLLGATKVVAWGSNTFGQTNVPAGLTNVVSVAAGDRFSLALRADGTIANWGGFPVPNTNITDTLSNIASLSLRGLNVLALKKDGSVVSWGNSSFNNLPAGLTNVVSIACGLGHYLALNADGTVIAWGDNASGQTNVPVSLADVVAVAAGSASSFALRNDGRLVAWGSLGNRYPQNLTNVVAVTEWAGSGIAVNSNGQIITWGAETNQGPLNIVQAIMASAGGFSQRALYVVQRNGSLAGWGGGVSDTNTWMKLTNVLSLHTGHFHTLAVVGDDWPEPALAILASGYTNHSFSVTQPSARGRSYVLEYNNSFDNSAWFMSPPIPGDGAIVSLTDRNAVDDHRIYRTRVQP